jgi:hypothetical protein
MTVYLDGSNRPATLREAIDAIAHNRPDVDAPAPGFRPVEALVADQDHVWTGTAEDFSRAMEAGAAQAAHQYPGDNTTIDDYYRHHISLLADRIGDNLPLEQRAYDQLSTEIESVADVEMGETETTTDQSLGTTGLGPCIAVGLTVNHQGHQYTALTHWNPEPGCAQEVIDGLKGAVASATGAPYPGNLANARWFAVGGSQATVPEQLELLEAMERNGIRATIGLANAQDLRDHHKVMGTNAAGGVFFAIETADQVHQRLTGEAGMDLSPSPELVAPIIPSQAHIPMPQAYNHTVQSAGTELVAPVIPSQGHIPTPHAHSHPTPAQMSILQSPGSAGPVIPSQGSSAAPGQNNSAAIPPVLRSQGGAHGQGGGSQRRQ